MAITIEDQPYQYTPIGQKLMVVCSSTNNANAGFRYIFDFGSFQVNVQPNAEGIGMLDLAPLFREKLYHDTLHSSVDAVKELSSVATIQCTIKEGWLVGGVFTVSGSGMADIDDVFAFLGEYQITDGYKPNPNERYALNDIDKYAMSERNGETHIWDEGAQRALSGSIFIPVRANDYGLLYFPSKTALLVDNEATSIIVTTYDNTDAVLNSYQYDNITENNGVCAFGAYPFNLLNVGVDFTGVHYYKVQAGEEILFPIYTPKSVPYVFYLVDDDCRFDNIRLGWSNTCGGTDYFNFTKKKELTYNYDRKQYQKVVGTYNTETFGFNTYDRGVTDRYVVTTKGLQINSDWISVGEFELLQTLCRSNDVFIIDDSGNQIPVLVDAQNFVIKDERYSKLYNVTLNLKYSQPVGL